MGAVVVQRLASSSEHLLDKFPLAQCLCLPLHLPISQHIVIPSFHFHFICSQGLKLIISGGRENFIIKVLAKARETMLYSKLQLTK